MNEELLINYENQPCYKIVFRPNFDDLIDVFNKEVAHTYDNICIVTDSNVAGLYLSEVISSFNNLDSNISSEWLYELLLFEKFSLLFEV